MAGRPFFITIGVTQASWRRRQQGRHRVGEDLAGGVVDVGLQQHDRLPAGHAELASRPGAGGVASDHHLHAFGRPSISRLPAPNPLASMRMAGSGPQADTVAARRAAPVGVVSSMRHVDAGGWAPLEQADDRGASRVGEQAVGRPTMPVPLATELERTSSMPSTSRAATVPTTSTMASRPPTSWK